MVFDKLFCTRLFRGGITGGRTENAELPKALSLRHRVDHNIALHASYTA